MRCGRATAAALVVTLGACTTGGATPETASIDGTADVTMPVDAPVDAGAARAASVRLDVSGCGPAGRSGMATAVDDHLLITAAHVVAGAEGVHVVGAGGRSEAVEVVGFDPRLDIAALRTEEPVAAPVTIRPDRAGAGERGIVIVQAGDGALEPVEVTVARRATIETTDIYRDADVSRAGFEIAASIEPGDSGAAVHLPGGMVGIVWARSTMRADRAWAIDVPDRFLDEATEARSPVDTGPCP